MIELPTKPIAPTVIDPRFLILYGKPKSGKTTIVAAMPDTLIIDLEGGTQYLPAVAVQARTIQDLREIAAAVREKIVDGKFPYKRLVIDNATRLEELCLPLALAKYQKEPQGKNFRGDIRTLPMGGGWFYVREAVKEVTESFKVLCEQFILVGHVKDKMINRDGKELSEMELDLAGKLGQIMCGLADAVGLVYREKNQTIVSFKGGEGGVLEARQEHLKGKNIVLAESDESNNITVYWDRIFKDN